MRRGTKNATFERPTLRDERHRDGFSRAAVESPDSRLAVDPRAGPAPGWLTVSALVAGIGFSLCAYLVPGFDVAYRSVLLTVAYEVLCAVAGLAAAYLLLGRTRAGGQLSDYLLAAALLVSVVDNLFFLAVPMAHAYGHASRFSTWSSAVGRLLEAALFVAAAFAGNRQLRLARRPAVIGTVLSAGAACLAIAVAISTVASRLPYALDERLSPVAPGIGLPVGGLPVGSGKVAVVMLASSLLFGLAAAALSETRGFTAPLHGWLRIGLAMLSLASANFVLFPSLYSQWVYVGDILEASFAVAVLVGVAAEVRLYWRQLVGAAVLEERRRIARNLHDGLAQELAFIVSQSKLLVPSNLSVALASSAERALEESRRAIDALTRPLGEPLDVSVCRAAAEVTARFDTLLTLRVNHGIHVEPAVHDAFRRITREATINAARHGRAEHIVVTLARETEGLLLRVEDDGGGFDPSAPSSGLGLMSMRERVASLGGKFALSSTLGSGTTVEVVLP